MKPLNQVVCKYNKQKGYVKSKCWNLQGKINVSYDDPFVPNALKTVQGQFACSQLENKNAEYESGVLRQEWFNVGRLCSVAYYNSVTSAMAKKLGHAKLNESQKLDTENDIAKNLDGTFCSEMV